MSIGPLGSWNKSADGAKSAAQFITLVGNDQAAAFEPQVATLRSLDRFIHDNTGVTKVPMTNPNAVTSVKLPEADESAIASIRNDWEPIQLADPKRWVSRRG
ncbi:hypothetical protein FOMPIDRAFT_94317 [Fomitopsis schrenkii]|uniref:Uncharacterized protein n=1 Tax=Fomitopsis schrenkii TaxID=2126942 RepID=S8ESF1_FOMSC|nr:hypothetical protein FOMPIDRAFT_94317 [Fomitopsis schrenkii]